MLSYKGHRYRAEINNYRVWFTSAFGSASVRPSKLCSNAVSWSATRQSGGGCAVWAGQR